MPKKSGGPKARRFTQAGITKSMKHRYAHLHSQYTGYHSAVVLQVAKKAISDRKSQFITHLASALKVWFSSLPKCSEIEIQLAIYDNRCLLIASNDNATAERIYKEVVAEAAKDFLVFLKGVAETAATRALKSKADESFRHERHARKLVREMTGARKVGLPFIDDLEAEGKDICVSFDVSGDIGDFTNFLNGDPDGRFVALLTSSTDMHAEQKILLGLCKAAQQLNRASNVIVAGTFRPCRGCFESLSVVQRYCFNNLQFGSRPGHYWRTTNQAHVEILKSLQNGGYISPQQAQTDFDENGLLRGLTDTSHRPSLRMRDDTEVDALHYATDSDSD
jgi:hypothetical protein